MAPSKTSSVLTEVITNSKNAVVPGVEVANLASISHGRILRSSTITKTGKSKDKVTVNPSTISLKEEVYQRK
jgi:phage regulator Rha-like protein